MARRPTAWKPPEMTSTIASVRALRRQSSRTAISHRERMPYRPIKTGVLVAFSMKRTCYVCNIAV